jgi:hypothetical protein
MFAPSGRLSWLAEHPLHTGCTLNGIT